MDFWEPVADFVEWIGTSIEFWAGLSILAVVAVGGWLWSRRPRWRQKRGTKIVAMPEEAATPQAPAVGQPDWQARNTAASPLIAAAVDMRTSLEWLDAIHPSAPRRFGDSTPASGRAAAHEAHARIQRLAGTNAVLLPHELAQRWHACVDLLGEYSRGATRGPDRWPGNLANRAQTDVDNYLQYLTKALAEYIKTGNVTKHCDPPVLRRNDMESWQSC